MIISESVGVIDSNETELLAIRRALMLWRFFGQGKLVIEGDSANTIKWLRVNKRLPYKLITAVREIKNLCIGEEISFVQVRWAAMM